MITEAAFRKGIVELIRRAEISVPSDYKKALTVCLKRETDEIAKLQLKTMLENLEMAEKLQRPICQDTGTFTFFVRVGGGLKFDLKKSIARATEEAARKVPLRACLVDPVSRELTKPNGWQPAVHVEFEEKRGLEVELLVKGAGTENYTRLYMLKPTVGESEILKTLCALLEEAGGKVCPPVGVGIGIGGSSETAITLAKRALLRKLGKRNSDQRLRRLELNLERAANSLNIGPMGLGGKTTVLQVSIETAPCHTASLPVGIAFQCWPGRRGRAVLKNGQLKVVEP